MLRKLNTRGSNQLCRWDLSKITALGGVQVLSSLTSIYLKNTQSKGSMLPLLWVRMYCLTALNSPRMIVKGRGVPRWLSQWRGNLLLKHGSIQVTDGTLNHISISLVYEDIFWDKNYQPNWKYLSRVWGVYHSCHHFSPSIFNSHFLHSSCGASD